MEQFGAVLFLFFTVVGALVLMTLFIGVITTAMEEAQSNRRKKRIENAEAAIIEAYGYEADTVENTEKYLKL